MKTEPPTFADLKERHRQLRDDSHEHLNIRTHRALSWLRRAELAREGDDLDGAFIFYWIAFNAIYSAERVYSAGVSERDVFSDFFRHLVELDCDKSVYNAIWKEFSESIRLLINNRYVFQPFWESHSGGDDDWEAKFDESRKQFMFAFRRQDTIMILCILFVRLYVLRNQLVHGAATWNSSTNRDQVRDGTNIMAFLIPIFIDLMINTPVHQLAKAISIQCFRTEDRSTTLRSAGSILHGDSLMKISSIRVWQD